MRWTIDPNVRPNSFEYFEKTLITDNGFREYDCRWLIGKEINPNGFVLLGRAYGTMARRLLGEDTVVVGHDFRAYSQDLCRSLVVGLLSTGVRVIDIGLSLTPMMYFAQHHFGCKAGVQVTASHNENGWTGVKLAQGLSSTLGPEGILTFRNFVKGDSFESGRGNYEVFEDLPRLYTEDAVRDGPLSRPMRVVLATGNGTAGRFAPAALRGLGCECIEIDCTPDWDFKRHNPNPEDVRFLHDIGAAVRKHRADVGVGIDGDGDRIGVVDEHGREIFADKLGLLVARWIAARHPKRPVVIDVKSTGLFEDDPVLHHHGMRVVMWKTGHSYIKAKVADEQAIAGFEKSGHWFFAPPIARGYDDAVVSAAQLLRMLDAQRKPLSEMVESLGTTWQSPTLGAYCPDDAKYEVVEQVTVQYREDQQAGTSIGGKQIKTLLTVNGIRFVLDDGSWGLVRASSNKPSLVVVAESRSSEAQMHDIVEHIKARLALTGRVGEYDQAMPPRAEAARATGRLS